MPKGPSITIASGQTESNAFALDILGNIDILFIYAPSSISGEVKPVVSATPTGTHIPLQSPAGTDILVTAGKAIAIMIQKGIVSLKLKTTVAPGADEVYETTIGIV